MSAPDAMLDKVRKLLAQAENPAATQAEAEAFTAKASKLMADYGIERAMLAEAEPETDTIGQRRVEFDAPYVLDKRDLLAAVAIPLRCKVVYHWRWSRTRNGKDYSATIFGYESDLDRTEMLYTSLLVQSAYAMAATYVPWGENPAAFRRAWLAGFSSAVSDRLFTAEREAAERGQAAKAATVATSSAPIAAGPSVALVLANREQTVKAAYEAAFPKLGKAKGRSLSGGGHTDGYRAGQRADLGTNNRVAASSTRALR